MRWALIPTRVGEEAAQLVVCETRFKMTNEPRSVIEVDNHETVR